MSGTHTEAVLDQLTTPELEQLLLKTEVKVYVLIKKASGINAKN